MKKAYKYRIYPTKKQADLLNEQLALYADLYNAALQERRDAYKLCGKSITFTQQESRRLVDRFGLIAVEALVVRTLVQRPSPKQDEETGRTVIKVPPAYTTQTCHDCGYRQE
jgi:transposase